jgi:hypothetical protein
VRATNAARVSIHGTSRHFAQFIVVARATTVARASVWPR